MENRKEYNEPEMKIVHLAAQNNLLDTSCPDSDGCGPFGLAPHEQDPLA
ncbi:MAG: hypothetical protein IK012_10285 [Fibrobacter sp.]|nr:hypothetical protein [Fibrobacter sp.]MBR4785620.1 hypothetical protein [Fibrobacter sp.]